MKSLLLSLLLLSPGSQFVNETLVEGQAILESQDGGRRFGDMCALIKTKFDLDHITAAWLGEYAHVQRDAEAIRRFPSLVPGILIAKVFGDLSGAGGKIKGSFAVDENPIDRGGGVLEVPVTLTSDAGRSFRGSAILREDGASFKAIDVEYMNMSAVDFQGRDYQDVLKEEYEKDLHASLPVSELIKRIESDGMYKACP